MDVYIHIHMLRLSFFMKVQGLFFDMDVPIHVIFFLFCINHIHSASSTISIFSFSEAERNI